MSLAISKADDGKLEEATDLSGIKAIPDLREAARAAVEAASTAGKAPTLPVKQPVQVLSPVIWSRNGQYETTRGNLSVKEGAKVLVMGTGKAVGPIRISQN